jgi:P-type Ca2+ transporter type 2C
LNKESAKIDDKYWYLRTVDEILNELDTSKKGLSHNEAQKRLNQYGHNSIAQEDKSAWLKILFKNFNTILIYILLASGLISVYSGHMVEFYFIMAIIFMTGFLGFIQEMHAGKSIEALSKLTAKKVDVLRDGKKHEINSEHLVKGDIVYVRRGMICPADLRLIEGKGISIDESILTGESVQKSKTYMQIEKQDALISEQDNIIFSGTTISAGSGTAVVVETGLSTELGKISLSLKSIKEQKSPLQKRVDVMSKRISFWVIILCVFFFILLHSKGVSTPNALLLVGALAVSGIPESFPLVLTLALSSGVKRMAKKNAIVKDLSSVETLGTTTVICTDKTGTLTENKMIVSKLFFPSGKEFNIDGCGYSPSHKFKIGEKEATKKEIQINKSFFEACALCNNSEVFNEEGNWILRGEPTEGALLSLAKSAGYDDVILKEDTKKIYEFPFDPLKKYMITIHQMNNQKNKPKIAYIKGAIEIIINKCSYYRDSKQKIVRLTEKDKKHISNHYDNYTKLGLRVIGIASKDLSKILKKDVDEFFNSKIGQKEIENNYIFEGLMGIEDPIRPEIVNSIKECYQAGIKVIMITGDHKNTAQSIGKKIGLIKSEYDLILEGREIDDISDEELFNTVHKVVIFARATPEHKLRIVNALQKRGEIVAMTGDGVNDAPALKKADIGVAMGKGGTDVARESSKLVLVDDNFKTIVEAVREGRTIYSNIRRFIFFFLTGNFTELGLIVLTYIIIGLSPFTALMILFINVVTSVFPASALSIEPTNPKVMFQKPRDPKEKLISSYILLKIFSVVPLLFFGTFFLFVKYLSTSQEKAMTVAFAAIIVFELFHAFNTRSLHSTIFNRRFFNNPYIFLAIGFSMTLLMFAIYSDFGQRIFKTVPLTYIDWAIIIGVSSTVVMISEFLKILVEGEIEERKRMKS